MFTAVHAPSLSRAVARRQQIRENPPHGVLPRSPARDRHRVALCLRAAVQTFRGDDVGLTLEPAEQLAERFALTREELDRARDSLETLDRHGDGDVAGELRGAVQALLRWRPEPGFAAIVRGYVRQIERALAARAEG